MRCANSAQTTGIPLVATNDCHYLHRDDAKAHEVLLCIQTGKTMADETRWRFDTDELYVKTPEEMAAAFGADSEAVRNTVEIANRVDFEFEFGKFHFPLSTIDSTAGGRRRRATTGTRRGYWMRRSATKDSRIATKHGCTHRTRRRFRRDALFRAARPRAAGHSRDGLFGLPADRRRLYQLRPQIGIPVGPGRGSVVGSLVSYALRITEVDPIEHKLLFERWLNPGRRSMPDIDVDFCFERRDEVLAYVRRKYGDDRVAQIITFGTIKGKQAIRDVGRVLGLSFAETDRIVKLYPAPKQGRDFPLRTRSRWSRG